MPKFAGFDAWLAQVRPQHAALLALLRRLIMDAVPGIEETINPWGAPAYSLSGADRCYLADHSKYVHLGFYDGASLPDPDGIVEGTGKRLRHIKVKSESEPPLDTLRKYLRAAADASPSPNAARMGERGAKSPG